MRPRSILTLIAAVWLVANPAGAQSLAERVLAAPGDVRMSFAAREDVCGDGDRVSFGWRDGGRDWVRTCEAGPIRLQLEQSDGRITRIRTYVGGRWTERPDVTDLGSVSALEASDFLRGLIPGADAGVAKAAVTAAVLADAPDPWPWLLELARNPALERGVRKQAVFWVGQSAADEATRGLADIVDDDAQSTEVQKAAVFALSRRDDPERVEQLLRVARTHPNREVVRAAFFWLAQSADDRALGLFEEVLSASPGAGRD